ncbi:hypothetical protein LDDCCGHA_3719 [Methylobacterium oxalidis]|nr:hypothetical protein LDDCCGHA_3719 [Methylobacterium oxalidis]
MQIALDLFAAASIAALLGWCARTLIITREADHG